MPAHHFHQVHQSNDMADLSAKYMGLSLRNPIIAGSSGLTGSVDKIVELEKAGIGAVVLKSLFEEQLRWKTNHEFLAGDKSYSYPEAEQLISEYSKENIFEEYLDLIRQSKSKVAVPIIASINCISLSDWIFYATKIQEAGADAIELNVFVLPSDPKRSGEQNEQVYLDVALAIVRAVTIPVSLKISSYFSGLSKTALKLSWTGIKGMVLFNRFYSPDIDIEKFEIVSSNALSTPEELSFSLRWVAMLSARLHCDIAASGGIHDGSGVIKQLLAGARAVQVTSCLYRNGFDSIPEMLGFAENWMRRHQFQSTNDFIGKLSFKEAENPAAYERVQFMKHFGGIN